jgi:hypothetical protein
MNDQRDEFGEKRLWETIAGFEAEVDLDKHLDDLVAAVEAFRTGFEANDDLTILAVGWKSP